MGGEAGVNRVAATGRLYNRVGFRATELARSAIKKSRGVPSLMQGKGVLFGNSFALLLWCYCFSTEREAVREAMLDTSEGEAWIVKPASSACGRGIYITKNFSDLPGQKLVCGSDSIWVGGLFVGWSRDLR